MLLAIIIASHSRIVSLKEILKHIYNQEDVKFTIKVIVIDDGSDDGTHNLLNQQFPDAIVINGDGNWWWTKCMNEGFKKAVELKCDYVLILNDDVEIKTDYLKTLLNDYSTLPENSILGSASVSIEKPHKIESAGSKELKKWRFKFIPYYSGFQFIDEKFKGIHPSYTLSGRGTLIPTHIFKHIGFYDERLVQYGSDDEFCLRAKLNGYPVYISWNALIYNHTMLTSKGSAFKKEKLIVFIQSFFNRYSINSISKASYFYSKYSYTIFLPFYIVYFILGTFKAYYFNYKKE